MKIKLSVNYTTTWGQSLFICGSASRLGNWCEEEALQMHYMSASSWGIEVNLSDVDYIEYAYFIKENNIITRREEGEKHKLNLKNGCDYSVNDLWNALPQQEYLYTSGFRHSFFVHQYHSQPDYLVNSLILSIKCPYVKKDEEVILSGSSHAMGQWDTNKALIAMPVKYGLWQVVLDGISISPYQEYKFAIRNIHTGRIVHWEVGGNRILNINSLSENAVNIEALAYRYGFMYWHGAGVSIPVFSLRTEDSFGIGEFHDLVKLSDWVSKTGQKVIQLLPVNDTTITHTWRDSYPYNSISIYALHPIYLGLSRLLLKGEDKNNRYKNEAKELNCSEYVDYEKVYSLKKRYLSDLFAESGDSVLNSEGFADFYLTNEHWLFPYACFSYLRDCNNTADFTQWGEFSIYNRNSLAELIASDDNIKSAIDFSYFTQYLLHLQLSEARDYAHSKGVILKGDIPIGISRMSVEAWTEPHLFNLDSQTGAPPDDFSVNGQNWGFPTYNWTEMAKDGYAWWKKRFRKMSDYFDAYRIDHILGFFRIWEIPLTSVQGLLGYFSPAMPLSKEDIEGWGIGFDEWRMTIPRIRKDFLHDIFNEYTSDVSNTYLHRIDAEYFGLNDYCDTQQKIKDIFKDSTDKQSLVIRDGLYRICNEILFVRDKYEEDKFHPRISAQHSYAYKELDDATRLSYNNMYEDFFYRRHNEFWKMQSMKKLPELVSATDMLVCGEDLGMIPDCVPSVMHDLHILSLEIERMPKQFGVEFADLHNLPYESVCTTSTHDMPPIRAWWNADRVKTQRYYNNVLKREGEAPSECTPDICIEILRNHLEVPSMLAIIPLQDWLSIDDSLRRVNAEDEQINEPSDANHYWKYRMHLTIEALINSDMFNNNIKSLIESAKRN